MAWGTLAPKSHKDGGFKNMMLDRLFFVVFWISAFGASFYTLATVFWFVLGMNVEGNARINGAAKVLIHTGRRAIIWCLATAVLYYVVWGWA